MIKQDISIVGAGPAGAIAALFLAKLGVDSLLIDKACFPREKICGDGISGWVVDVLNELNPEMTLRLSHQPYLLHSHGIRIVAPNQKILDLPFLHNGRNKSELPPGFICRRIDFDNFLITEIRKQKQIRLVEGVEIVSCERSDNGLVLTANDGNRIESRLVIFATGANSPFTRNPGGILKEKKYIMTGLKAYFEGVTGFHPDNYVELHFLKGLLPGYFWIFPLPGNIANVGVGLDQERIRRKKINLKKVMLESIAQIPYLEKRFRHSRQVSKVEAHSLPLWDGQRKISGDHFLLAGDTASLIDPVTGEGMGHAAISGMFAAQQAFRSLEKNDFSAGFMNWYDEAVYSKIGRELQISSKIPGFIRFPWLFNAMVSRAVNSKSLQQKLALAMTDLEVRKRLKEPSMYFKVLAGR